MGQLEMEGLPLERFAPHKAALAGVLGSCLYSAWRFQRDGKRLRGLGPRALCVGLACGAASASLSWWRAVQVRRHSVALDRLARTSEAVRLVPISNDAPPLPASELDAATGQRALEANAELLKQIRQEDRAEGGGRYNGR
mmetsp:Transcript_67645/g.135851  ORF Transcript_67645/g.135851 Transcript_67645/m.135851 type:complete len:140 (-) Transcript_67645:83-502(-)